MTLFRKPAVLSVLALLLLLERPLAGESIAVRFSEGVVHGFLVLKNTDGSVIASGDLFQTAKGAEVESRMVFHFKDGSVSDEKVTYTQQSVFTMQTYHLLQKGPAFSDDMEGSLERSGKYSVKTKAHKDGKEKVFEGSLDLPPDVYNGMVITVLKNLRKSATETVHFVAFTPKPRLIQLELVPEQEEKVHIAESLKSASEYVLKPELGVWLKLFAKVSGQTPPDYHAWILREETPAFLRIDGPLFMGGPIWRIELSAPKWPT